MTRIGATRVFSAPLPPSRTRCVRCGIERDRVRRHSTGMCADCWSVVTLMARSS